MILQSLRDWFLEHERRMSPVVFVVEWALLFFFALVTCALFFLSLGKLSEAAMISTASSALLACVFVYVRLFWATGCQKCGSPLPFIRHEIDRKYAGNQKKYLEVVRSWSQGPAGLVDICSKTCRIEKVRFRCKRCRHEWVEEQQISVSSYRFHHSINLNDQL